MWHPPWEPIDRNGLVHARMQSELTGGKHLLSNKKQLPTLRSWAQILAGILARILAKIWAKIRAKIQILALFSNLLSTWTDRR